LSNQPVPSTVLLLTPDDDDGLTAVMRSCCGKQRVVRQAFDLAAWLHEDLQRGLGGVLLDTDRLALADLRVIAASLSHKPEVWLMLLVGDRGVVGFEELLERPRTALLPKPWTPRAVQQTYARLTAASTPPGAFPQAFLDGLVEGLRDPLTSISGYLQLLGGQGNDNLDALVAPALEAASQLAAQLEFLHLAAAELHPHPDSHDLGKLAEELVDYAEKAGQSAELDVPQELRVEGDLRYLRASMQSALLLLQRFGSGGPIRLVARQDGERIEILWQQQQPATAPQHPMPPPAYLEDLFQRLCRRIPAQAVVTHVHGCIPSVLGVAQ
jgi:signal transduction histidine kinase